MPLALLRRRYFAVVRGIHRCCQCLAVCCHHANRAVGQHVHRCVVCASVAVLYALFSPSCSLCPSRCWVTSSMTPPSVARHVAAGDV